jgi:uncharacterized protein YyaL (SSP411 family)
MPEPTNALADETSPYLLQHAHNPVDWMPWGQAAFDAARRRGVPIFLSIGYATCYWCHVMERESFEDPAIGALLNERFVCVKVDREERPDVDEVYMTAVQLMTGQGGWPMSVWLTPPGASQHSEGTTRPDAGGERNRGLLPFYAGTYFPPVPGHGRPSFRELIVGIGEAWRDRRADVLDQATRVGEAVRNALAPAAGQAEHAITIEQVDAAAERVLRMHDARHGGFGGAPKFPQPSWPRLLIARGVGGAAVVRTLDAMADGGLFDQVGGGFHRYSTDAAWRVPHFEKMLYDNGQLLSLYAEGVRSADTLCDGDEAAAARCRQRWSRVLRETSDYVLREMVDATGALWSAQDAEVDGREGLNYLWTPAEVESAMAEAGETGLVDAAKAMYGLDGPANFRDPHHPRAEPAWVLAIAEPARMRGDASAWVERERVNAALRAARDRRKPPGTDDKVLAAWNGMAVRGLADAGRVLGESRFVEAAGRAMRAVLRGLGELDGGLRRSMRHGKPGRQTGFLEDYAFVIDGLLALHAAERSGVSERAGQCQPGEAATPGEWLAEAERLCEVVIDRFSTRSTGGYHDTLADQADLLVRTRSLSDGAVPSGNSQMVHDLVGLYEATGNGGYLVRAVRDVRAMAGAAEAEGAGGGGGVGSAWWVAGVGRLLGVLPEGLRGELARSGQAERSGVSSDRADSVVAVRVERGGWSGDELRAELGLTIAEGYHVHGPGVQGDGRLGLRVSVVEPGGAAVSVAWPATDRVAMGEESVEAYRGEVVLPVRVSGLAEGVEAVVLEMGYQACGRGACLPPCRVGVTLSTRPTVGDEA